MHVRTASVKYNDLSVFTYKDQHMEKSLVVFVKNQIHTKSYVVALSLCVRIRHLYMYTFVYD